MQESPLLMTVAALAALAGSPASAQTSSSGPLVYVGRVIVQSAVVEGTTTACSGGSDTPATGDTYSGVLRLPGNPANWKLEILNSAFAARVVRVAPHHVSATIFNSNGTLGVQNLRIAAGGTLTQLPSGATAPAPYVELPITLNIPSGSSTFCTVEFFMVGELPPSSGSN